MSVGVIGLLGVVGQQSSTQELGVLLQGGALSQALLVIATLTTYIPRIGPRSFGIRNTQLTYGYF